ncbi:hypothetical protein niasHS_012226 [Heterodera schachtii]|uniref:Uncharacterized protein n=1 Tax=Heterodera schachtii TaxID=97005 RepID=A0ABD2IJU6_HETSC
MIIVTANENLLERLVLLVQNKPRGDNASLPPPVRAQTVLIASSANSSESVGLPTHSLAHCSTGEESTPPRNWVLLMAKKGFGEHLNTLRTLADLYRLSMSNSVGDQKGTAATGQSHMRILIIKKDRSDDDKRCLQEHLDAVRAEWVGEWSARGEKNRKFGESDAQKEHLTRATRWNEPTVPNCALSYFDDPNLLDAIYTFFGFGTAGFQIVSQSEEENEQNYENRCQLFTKPPALHWTNYPRDSEVQMAFKFVFPAGTITEWVFREWTKAAKQSLCWDYVYEWTNGVLLRAEELIKVTVTRCSTRQNLVEIAGRIDTDEAEEEMEMERIGRDERSSSTDAEAAAANRPLLRVWPYLARVFSAILTDVERRRTLPFSLNLVFIGDIFFVCPEGAPKISARSLDALQTLSSVQRVGSVRFRVDQQHIHSLDLSQCFPDFCPTKLADFSADHFALPPPPLSAAPSSSSSSPSADGATTGTSLLGSALPSERHTPTIFHRTERSPSCTPEIALSGGMGGKMPLSPSNSLLVERQLFKHRSRRVSFGVIHAIPSFDAGEAAAQISPGKASPSLIRPMNRCPNSFPTKMKSKNGEQNEKEDDEEEEEQKQSELVKSVVDEMLQKAIKEVLVTD